MRRILLTLMLLSVLSPLPALAHAAPDLQVPAENAVVSPPAEIRLTFNEALEPAFSGISLSREGGATVPTGKAMVLEPGRRAIRLPLPALAPGVYIVNWAVVSIDGHRTKGQYRFTVK